jgi:hypothetical protein
MWCDGLGVQGCVVFLGLFPSLFFPFLSLTFSFFLVRQRHFHHLHQHHRQHIAFLLAHFPSWPTFLLFLISTRYLAIDMTKVPPQLYPTLSLASSSQPRPPSPDLSSSWSSHSSSTSTPILTSSFVSVPPSSRNSLGSRRNPGRQGTSKWLASLRLLLC